MSKTIHYEKDNTETTPRPSNRSKNAKIRYETTVQINEAIHSDPSKNEKNSDLFKMWVENIIDRAYPLSEENSQSPKELSELDCYYIPDINDETIQDLLTNTDKIYEMLNGLICRPQLFWRDRKTGERTMDKEWRWLKRLNYILNMAAKHTLRHIEESSLRHTNPKSNSDTPGFWDPDCITTEDEEHRIWYNYFKHKLKDFTESQRSDKDKKQKIYFNIKSKEQFCQLVRALLVDYVPVIAKDDQIYASTYKNDYCEYRLDDNPDFKKKHLVPVRVIHKKEDNILKPLSTRVKDWLFLKNISCFADIERSDGYAWRHTHFEQIKGEIFNPLFQVYKPIDVQNTQNTQNSKKSKKQRYANRQSKKLDNHEMEDSIHFDIDYKRRKIEWNFILCTKSQDSILDKTRRDIDYSAATSLKDIIRWSFIMKDHHDVIFMLHYFIKYFIKNPEHNFDHDSSYNDWFDPTHGILRWLQLKDKWILNTEIAQWIKNIWWLPKWTMPPHDKQPKDFTNEELNWAATKFITSSIEKSSSKKSSNSTEYIDVKLIVPTLMRPNPLDMEIKFLTEDNYKNNESGLADHDIMRWKQVNKRLSRDERFILVDKIKQDIKLLLERDPELKSQIEAKLIAQNRWKDNLDAEEEIFKDIIEKLHPIYGKNWKNWVLEQILFCDKEIWDHLINEWFNFNADWFHYSSDETE